MHGISIINPIDNAHFICYRQRRSSRCFCSIHIYDRGGLPLHTTPRSLDQPILLPYCEIPLSISEQIFTASLNMSLSYSIQISFYQLRFHCLYKSSMQQYMFKKIEFLQVFFSYFIYRGLVSEVKVEMAAPAKTILRRFRRSGVLKELSKVTSLNFARAAHFTYVPDTPPAVYGRINLILM